MRSFGVSFCGWRRKLIARFSPLGRDLFVQTLVVSLLSALDCVHDGWGANFPLTERHHRPVEGRLHRGGREEADAARRLIPDVADAMRHHCWDERRLPDR